MTLDQGSGGGDTPLARALTISTTGAVAGLMVVALALSFASLLFAGDLRTLLPVGSALILGGSVLMNVVSAWRSSMPGAIVIPQDATTAVVAVTVAGIAAGLAVGDRLGTTLAVVAVGSLLTAVAMLTLGYLRAGNLVRYVPLPVMGGFLAGTGWLLVAGGTEIAVAGGVLGSGQIANLVAGFALGAALILVLRRPSGVVHFATLVAGSVAAFYVVLLLAGIDVPEARTLGLLPTEGAAPGLFRDLGSLSVRWDVVVDALPRLVTVPIVATLGMLLNVGGLELIAGRDAVLDRELQAAGWANAAAAVTGTPAGYHALGASALGFRVGAHSRVVPLVVAGVCAAAIVLGPGLVGLIPVFVTAGVLVMLGAGFLSDWLVERRRTMPVSEYVLMLTIVAVVAAVGFLPGVMYGMAAAVVLFTVRYSRLDPIRARLTAAERRSSREWSPAELALLRREGGSIRIVELQGYLFFGTAHTAVAAITSDLDGARHLIVDFHRVEGCDSSAVLAFSKLAAEAARTGVDVVASHADGRMAVSLAGIGVSIADDLDHALEACEREVLSREVPDEAPVEPFLPASLWRRLAPHFVRMELEEGAILAEPGDGSRSLYLVESGRIAAEIRIDDGRFRRVRSVGPGGVLGEFSLYDGTGRTARLRVREAGVVHRLSPDAVEELERIDPEGAIAFHRAVARLLIERLSSSNEVVRALIR